MSKSVKIWFPTYIGDFFTTTASMTGHEVGAYQLIIAALWKAGGSIPADDKQLAKLVKASARQWKDIKDTLWPLFEIKAGLLTHPATTAEIEIAQANSEKRRLAGIASGAARKGTHVQHEFDKGSTKREPRADEGEGEGSYPVVNPTGDGSIAREAKPFRVMEGGAK